MLHSSAIGRSARGRHLAEKHSATPVWRRPTTAAFSAQPAGGRRGMTMVELVAGITLLIVGVLGFAQTLVCLDRGQARTREAGRATQAARAVLERIQAEAFPEAFRRFNGDGADDPGGANTAPGNTFA